MTENYIIADFGVRIEWAGDRCHAAGAFAEALRPFAHTFDDRPLLTLRVDCADPFEGVDAENSRELDNFDFAEIDARCTLGRTSDLWLFTMRTADGRTCRFRFDPATGEARSDVALQPADRITAAFFRFGLWIMFGLAAAVHQAIPIHSSVIEWGDGAALFLGESGTGKSTHTRLWREHIAGVRLLNDDSPILRIKEGEVRVYGSPWSGKTPCFRDIWRPVSGFVRLSQAPHNRIRRLPVIAAIGALLPSCPPSFAFDEGLQDSICDTLSDCIARIPVYHMECLPDAAAAELAHKILTGRG